MNTFEDLLNDLEEAPKRLKAQKSTLLKKLGEDAANKVKKHTPVDTGNLRDSIRYRIKDDSVEIYSDSDYAEAIDKGHVAGSKFVPGKNMFEKGMMEADANSSIIDTFLDEFQI